MLLLLFALQLSSTNCIPDYSGGMNCTTMTMPTAPPSLPQMQMPMPPTSPNNGSGCALCNIVSIIDGMDKRRHSKAVGQMLAAGNCEGAEQYALNKGDFDLVGEVRDYCRRGGSVATANSNAARWVEVESADNGTKYYVDPQSIRREGDYHTWWMRVIYPPADQIRETSVLSLYRCRDGANAIKMFVSYLRNGKVQLHTVPDANLSFEPLSLTTPIEKGLVAEVCATG